MTAPSPQRSLYEALLHFADATPDAPCVIEPSASHSYGEVGGAARRVVGALQGAGVQPGDRVALVAPNSSFWVSAYLGIGGAGAAAVPMSPQVPALEMARRLDDVKPRVVLHTGTAAPVVVAGVEWLTSSDALASEPAAGSTPTGEDTLALLVYTSGSEGVPKAACLSQGNVLSNTAAIVDYLGLTASDRMGVVLPFTYVYGLSLLHTHIAVGASLVLENRFMFPQVAVDTLRDTECTGFAGVPSTFALLLERTEIASTDLSNLRYVTQAGGAMAPELIERVVDALPTSKLFVMYGATEATARLTYLHPDRLVDKLGSIGKPISGVDLRIEDHEGALVKPGDEGELLAAGPNIMGGYWNDSETTSQVLVDREGATYYRTGDLARVDEDGFYFIVGRKRDFIKAGAHRVAAQEVEHAIVAHPGVVEVAVVGVPDPLRGETIEAVIVGEVSEDELQDFLRGQLAPYAVPTRFRFVDALPKNEAGKVLKRNL